MLLDKYNSISRVKDIKAEATVLLAENDEVISRGHSQRLIDEFPVYGVQIDELQFLMVSMLMDLTEWI